jgi:MFS family permease
MSDKSASATTDAANMDFLKFWVGQTVSNLGSSITLLAFPLLIYARTDSALSLSLMSMANLLPYPLFGLFIGAWVDRVDRKRLMIAMDLVRAALVATIPLMAWIDGLPLAWIYMVGFLNSTLSIAFNSAEFAAIPSLVSKDALVTANGRIQASYAGATVLGPIIAGLMAGLISIEFVILVNSVSYLVSAAALSLIARTFNTEAHATAHTSIRSDVVEGLRYVFGHPVLRAISIMMAIFNFIGTTVMDQLVLFSERRLGAVESQVGVLYSAASVGIIVLSLLAGKVRERWPFSRVAIVALVLHGAMLVALAVNTSYWAALPIMAMMVGLGVLFNINTGSLRQLIVPDHLLGRVMSIAAVAATSLSPIGTILGGAAIEATGNVAIVYGGIGILMIITAIGFSFTALGSAERYLPGGDLERAPSMIEPSLTPAQSTGRS